MLPEEIRALVMSVGQMQMQMQMLDRFDLVARNEDCSVERLRVAPCLRLFVGSRVCPSMALTGPTQSPTRS